MTGLADRRNQLLKKKAKSKKLYGTEKFANHMTPCSCYMCGNPRKHFNEKSMQERKNMSV